MHHKVQDAAARVVGLLALAGFARAPQISLPLGTLEGCPVGLSLIAAPGNDVLLLSGLPSLTAHAAAAYPAMLAVQIAALAGVRRWKLRALHR